jgi:hypothetical protein
MTTPNNYAKAASDRIGVCLDRELAARLKLVQDDLGCTKREAIRHLLMHYELSEQKVNKWR